MAEMIIEFHPITLADRDWMNEKLKEEHPDACEYTFANNFIWAEVYHVQVGCAYGCGVIRSGEEGHFQYSFPFGSARTGIALTMCTPWRNFPR